MVSEPPEDDQDTDCEDVGVAFVSVKDILEKGRDVRDEDIPSEILLTLIYTSTLYYREWDVAPW